MKKPVVSILAAAIAVGALFTSPVTQAADGDMRHYAVTITNITRGQIMAPPAVIAHNDSYSLFNLGSPAIPELSMLAEEGSPVALVNSATSMPSVYRATTGSGIIMPGASQTIDIETTGKFPEISVAAMLVSTNDGFMAVRGMEVPKRGSVTAEADAYDAGSEANSESCAFVPGPPCGSHVHDSSPAEGYVHIHAGIHGIGGLTPAMHDWRGAVAQIEIKRID